jgi:hypothetical protein
VQAKGRGNIFNKRIAENSTNLKKEIPIQVEEAYWTQNRHNQNRTSSQHSIVKTMSRENKARIRKAMRGRERKRETERERERERRKITYKRNKLFPELKKNSIPGILPAKLSLILKME